MRSIHTLIVLPLVLASLGAGAGPNAGKAPATEAAATDQSDRTQTPTSSHAKDAAPATAKPDLKANDPQIQLVPAVTEVTLAGRPGSELSLTRRLSLMSDKAVPELLLRPSDLQQQGGTQSISQAQFHLVSGDASLKNLEENTPRDIDFKVSDLKVPGTYRGFIDFLLPKHGVTPAVHIPFELRVEETPKLTIRKGSENLKIQLVNCSLLGCYLTKKFYPSKLQEEFTFPLDNGSLLPFDVKDAAASASGDVHHLSTGSSIKLSKPIKIPTDPIVSIPFTLATGDLVPDHYVGDIQLRIPGKDEPLKIPLELNVRTAPALPIVVLIIGILLGRLIKYMKEKGTPQSDLLRLFLQVQARAAQNPADLGLLQHMLQQARIDIDAMRLDVAKAALTVIENRLTLLSRLRSLETLLTPRSAEAPVAAILTNINQARNLVSLGADPTALANQIEQQVQQLPLPAGPANPAARALEVAAATSVRGAAPFATAGGAPPPPVTFMRRAVAFLTGHSDARADLTLWFLRPLAWVVLVLLLTVTGFVQLYLKNPTFGADVVSDYFGLLVWAAGSDVAGRTLSNFKGP